MESGILTQGFDYFTATTDKDRIGLLWYQKWRAYADRQEKLHFETKAFKNRWYEGVRSHGLIWGHSDRLGYIVMGAGETGHSLWTNFLPNARRVTRIDLQVTVRLPEPDLTLAQRSYTQVKHIGNRTSSFIQNSKGGTTLYVGSRQSEHFGRLYDRGVRSGEFEPGLVWRYEVELKANAANVITSQVLEQLREHPQRPVDTTGFVHRWFRNRGVFPIWDETTPTLVYQAKKAVTSADKKLSWFRSQVKPSVKWLIEEGLLRETLDALGLDWQQMDLWNGSGHN